jgi:WD40 repeat protein
VGLFVAIAAAWWFWSGPPRLPIVRTLKLPGGEGWPLAFSKDGALLATGRPSGNVYIWDVASGQVRATRRLPGWPHWTVFSPDNQMVAAYSVVVGVAGRGQPTTVTVFNTSGGSQRTAFEVAKSILLPPKFSRDGSSFGAITWDDARNKPLEFRSWETTDWKERPARPLAMKKQNMFALSSDERIMATGHHSGPGLSLWDLTTQEPTETPLADPASPPCSTRSLQLSPSGRTLARARWDGPLELWDLRTKTRSSVIPPTTAGFYTLDANFTPDERTLVTQELEGGPLRGVIGTLRFFTLRAMSLGRYDERPRDVVVRDLPSGRVRAVLKEQYRHVVSDDGKVLATTNANGTLTLWDLGK